MGPSRAVWDHMVPRGPLLVPYEFIWTQYGPICGSYVTICGSHMNPSEPHMGSYGFIWPNSGPTRPSRVLTDPRRVSEDHPLVIRTWRAGRPTNPQERSDEGLPPKGVILRSYAPVLGSEGPNPREVREDLPRGLCSAKSLGDQRGWLASRDWACLGHKTAEPFWGRV